MAGYYGSEYKSLRTYQLSVHKMHKKHVTPKGSLSVASVFHLVGQTTLFVG